MRILFISTTFPDETAPARGTYNSAVCAALANEHQVRVVAPRSFTSAIPQRLRGTRYQLPEELKASGIQAEYPTFWYTPRFKQEYSGDQMWWSVKKTIQRQIKDFQPDAVLSYWAHPEGEVGVRAAQLAQVPSAVIVGGSDVLLLPKIPKRGERVRDVLVQSDTVITVSNGLRDSVIELGTSPERVQTIYQGIDPNVFHTKVTREAAREKLGLGGRQSSRQTPSAVRGNPRDFRLADGTWNVPATFSDRLLVEDIQHLVWVGRMVSVKALDVLIDAVATLKKINPNFALHLIGDGPERGRIEQRVQSEALSQNVSFEGSIGHDQIADWYRAADVTVMSSDSEGLPNVLRESLACGTPFVTTDVGSIQEIADDTYSVLVPKQNSAALADGIKQVLSGSYTENARQYDPRTWNVTAQETVELFEKLIQEQSFNHESGQGSSAHKTSTTVLQTN